MGRNLKPKMEKEKSYLRILNKITYKVSKYDEDEADEQKK